MWLSLSRTDSGERGTFGTMTITNDSSVITFRCVTLELPWRLNAHRVSCIPAGVYPFRLIWSQKHACRLYHICDVPNRDDIEVHIGNFLRDTDGCVLVGNGIAADRSMLHESGLAFGAFMLAMEAQPAFQNITVHDAPGFNTREVVV